MKGLLIKDFLLQMNLFIKMMIFIVVMVLFGILGILSIYYGNFHSDFEEMELLDSVSITRLLWGYSFILGVLSGSSAANANRIFKEDDRAEFGKISASLPVTVRQRVMARYLHYGIWLISMLILNLILQPIIYQVAGISYTWEACLMIFAGISLCTGMALINMPFMYRYGIKIEMLISVFLTMIGIVLVFVFLNHIIEHNVPIDTVVSWLAIGRNSLAVLFLILMIVGMPLSAMCSIGILERRKNQLW